MGGAKRLPASSDLTCRNLRLQPALKHLQRWLPLPPPGLIKQKRLASVGEPGHGATSVPALNSLSTYIFGTSATPCWLSTAAIAISCRS